MPFSIMVVAVVQPAGEHLDPEALITHVRGSLAAYKAPRDIVTVDDIGRAPNGKVDYTRLRSLASDQLNS